MSDEIKSLYNYEQAAEILNLAPQTLRQWVSGEKIPFIKLGRAVRFTPEMINDMITNGVDTKGWTKHTNRKEAK